MAARNSVSRIDDTWRVFRYMAEFVDGFETLSSIGPCITIFGSARTLPDHRYYALTERVARLAVKNGYGIITGGGPGIMEAANKGASDGGGISIGLNIQLPFEQVPNRFIKTLLNFRHFFSRKVMFLKYTSAVIVFPGGYGTLDEMFEALTLIQTQKATYLPLVLMGTEYWDGLIGWLDREMLGSGYIDDADMKIMTVTDDPQKTIDTINSFHRKRDKDVNFE